MVLDQKYREALSLISDPAKTDSIAKAYNLPPDNMTGRLWFLQMKIDSSNIIFAEQILKQYGYPGKSLVGEPTNQSVWDIIQHSEKIDQYLPVIKKAADKKELPYYLYGMMLDRSLMYNGKEQVYGSQGSYRALKNGKKQMIIWPIKNPEKVNQLRKDAGFTQTVEDNATRLGIKYQVLKLDDLEPVVKKK